MHKYCSILCFSAALALPSIGFGQWMRDNGEVQPAAYYIAAFRFIDKETTVDSVHYHQIMTCGNTILSVSGGSQNPLEVYYYKFYRGGEMMDIEFIHRPCANIFIDSLYFVKGHFNLTAHRCEGDRTDSLFDPLCIGQELHPPEWVVRLFPLDPPYKLEGDVLFSHWCVSELRPFDPDKNENRWERARF